MKPKNSTPETERQTHPPLKRAASPAPRTGRPPVKPKTAERAGQVKASRADAGPGADSLPGPHASVGACWCEDAISGGIPCPPGQCPSAPIEIDTWEGPEEF